MAAATRSLLLTEAERVIRQRGFTDFSFADLATAAGIRKASVHHHFPTKAALGGLLLEAYTARLLTGLKALRLARGDALQRLRGFAGLYRASLEAGQACLCGVLAAELAALSPAMQAGVRDFFALNIAWLSAVLAEGQAEGSLRADLDPASQATAVLATLQGALLLGQTLGIPAFEDALGALLAGLQPLTSLKAHPHAGP